MTLVGVCELCKMEILAPRDAVVWTEDYTYHRLCKELEVAKRIADDMSASFAAPSVAGPAPSGQTGSKEA